MTTPKEGDITPLTVERIISLQSNLAQYRMDRVSPEEFAQLLRLALRGLKCDALVEALEKIARPGQELDDGKAEHWTWGNGDDSFSYGGSCARDELAVEARDALAAFEAGT